MKKILCCSIVLAALLTLAACGKKDDSSDSKTGSAANASSSSVNDGSSEKADIPGVLYQLDPANETSPTVKGISLSGNCAGSGAFNERPTSAEGIRCVFELQEWISIALDSDKSEGLTAYVVEPAKEYGEDFIAGLADEVPRVQLTKPEEEDETTYWGEFFVNSDDWKAGNYDLVIADGSKPIAKVPLKLYAPDGLQGKSDVELSKLEK